MTDYTHTTGHLRLASAQCSEVKKMIGSTNLYPTLPKEMAHRRLDEIENEAYLVLGMIRDARKAIGSHLQMVKKP